MLGTLGRVRPGVGWGLGGGSGLQLPQSHQLPTGRAQRIPRDGERKQRAVAGGQLHTRPAEGALRPRLERRR